MKHFVGTVDDYQNGIWQQYEYPKKPDNISKVRLPFDLIMTKKGKWYYMWSSENTSDILQVNAAERIKESGELYKIVNAITGEIIRESGSMVEMLKK